MSSMVEYEQGTDEWMRWRRGLDGTATQASIVMGHPPPWGVQTWSQMRLDQNFERDIEINYPMAFGKMMEVRALEAAQEHFGIRYQPACVEIETQLGADGHAPTRKLGASLDGFLFDGTTHHWIEIKCPVKGAQSTLWQKVLEGGMPHYYFWQMMHQWYCLGAPDPAVGHLVVYDEPSNSILTRTVNLPYELDVAYTPFEEMWRSYLNGERQWGDMSISADFRNLEREYMEASHAAKTAEKAKKEARDAMIKMAETEFADESLELRQIWGDKIWLRKVVSKRLDRGALETDHPNLVDQYRSESASWRTFEKKS